MYIYNSQLCSQQMSRFHPSCLSVLQSSIVGFIAISGESLRLSSPARCRQNITQVGGCRHRYRRQCSAVRQASASSAQTCSVIRCKLSIMAVILQATSFPVSAATFGALYQDIYMRAEMWLMPQTLERTPRACASAIACWYWLRHCARVMGTTVDWPAETGELWLSAAAGSASLPVKQVLYCAARSA